MPPSSRTNLRGSDLQPAFLLVEVDLRLGWFAMA